jgi:hypothetical protein
VTSTLTKKDIMASYGVTGTSFKSKKNVITTTGIIAASKLCNKNIVKTYSITATSTEPSHKVTTTSGIGQASTLASKEITNTCATCATDTTHNVSCVTHIECIATTAEWSTINTQPRCINPQSFCSTSCQYNCIAQASCACN